jgi:hypothetical protein
MLAPRAPKQSGRFVELQIGRAAIDDIEQVASCRAKS